MVDTTSQPTQPDSVPRVSRRTWSLIVAVVALVAVVVILGVLLATNTETSGSDLPAEVEAILDDYTGAMVAGDADAWQQTITEDWFLREYLYSQKRQELSDIFSGEEDTPHNRALRIEFFPSIEYERVGERLVAGDRPWFVSEHQLWTEVQDDGSEIVWDVTVIYVVVERDGELRVASEVSTGTASILDEN